MSVKGPVGGAEEEKTLRETVLPEGLREPLSFWADPDEILVWKRYTWGSFGQHDNIYTFVITPQLQTKAIFEVVRIKHLNKDSRKNYRRFTYVKVEDLLQLQGYILKIVFDEATSSKRRVTAHYLLVQNGQLLPLESESGLRDNKGFYDLVKLPNGRALKVRKEGVETA